PDAVYVSPESTQYGEHSFKSHLFSLGMTLLFATEYNTGSDDPRSEISDRFTDLLTSLTQDDSQLRPDLDTVIEACERTLGVESSQDICLRIVGIQPNNEKAESEDKPDSSSSIQQMTDDLSVYLQTQSGFVETQSEKSEEKEAEKKEGEKSSKKDVNDNSITVTSKESPKRHSGKSEKTKLKVKEIVREVSFDEDDSMLSDLEEVAQNRRARKQKGIMLNDVLTSLDRYLDECELWSLCKESVLTLQRKKKHLPAYISPDTVMVRECGSVSFKAIPEEKPLEVIYMAPELQAKGVLSEKTCLYGLGITLKSSAGGKYTTSLSLPDAEALDILLSSFLQLNQHKRPTLDTALEMCEEYYKVSEVRSRDVCKKVYREALEAASTKSEASSQEPPSKNSWDESEADYTTQASTDNTRSLVQAGDTTEAEDNIDDIPFDDDQDDTKPTSGSAFKSIKFATETNDAQTEVSSAFKPVAVKAKPAKKLERVPSAFSSPATHFKPIVIQDKASNSESSKPAGAKETDVVGKLREIKDNLQRHRNNDVANKEVKTNKRHLEDSSNTQQNQSKQNNQAPAGIGSLDQAMLQLQAQGSLQNTDALASAIAHYLKNHLSGGLPPLSSDQSQQNRHTFIEPADKSAFTMGSPSQQHPATSAPNPIYPSGTTTIPSNATSTIMSTFSSSGSSPMYNLNPQPSYSPGNLGTTLPLHRNAPLAIGGTLPTSGVAPILGPYPAPFHNLGQMPVHFTLVRDPVTGLMQMVPCMLPISSQPSPSLSQAIPIPSYQQVPTSTDAQVNGSNSGYKTYEQSNTLLSKIDPLHASQPQQQQQLKGTQPRPSVSHPSFVHTSYPESHNENITRQDQNDTKPTLSHPMSSVPESRFGNPSHGQSNIRFKPTSETGRVKESESQSSSPSPSKDSGICVTQQPPALAYTKDPLMERLLSSQDSQRQRILSHVLRILREEFADDGVFDSGVEDLAIAEYIVSLSSLTWETFRCAITEKFFHLVWKYDLLAVLYETIGGSPSPQFRNLPKTPPTAPHKMLFHQGPYEKTEGGHSLQHGPHASGFGCVSGRENVQSLANSGTDDRISLRNFGPYQYQQRPRSEAGAARGMWSETSDSTDTDARDKRRRFRKRGELDKSKSSSLHNISAGINMAPGSRVDNSTIAMSNFDPGAITSHARSIQSNLVSNTVPRISAGMSSDCAAENHPKKFNSGSSSTTHTPVLKSSDGSSQPAKYSDIRTANVSALPYTSSKSGSSQDQSQSYKAQQSPRHTQGGFSPRLTNILPSKPVYPRSSHYPSSHLLPSREYAGSSSSNSPNDHQPGKTHIQSVPRDSVHITNDAHIRYRTSPSYDNEDDSETDKSAEMRRLAAKKPELFQDTRSSKGLYSSDKITSKHVPINTTSSSFLNGIRAFNNSRPEQRTSHEHSSVPHAGNVPNNRLSVPDHATINNGLNTPLASVPKHQFTSSMSALPSYEPSTSTSKTRSDHMNFNISNVNYSNNTGSFNNHNSNYSNHPNAPNSRSNPTPYGRSLSAVYTRRQHPQETGVVVVGSSVSSSGTGEGETQHAKGHHRRGSDGSVHLPELNSALLPFSNKGQIVYHSAMIQLNLTTEVDEFIHSIDEENRRAIEIKLASVKQEITVQQRQRKKTQRFYRKLNEQTTEGKNSKGDQAISEQMLKDMTEMTRKISFLQLCQTHLQMLLAELYGLDTCFLYSLAATEQGHQLVLQPALENQYLQFRIVSTVEAGQMSVLQAGTPRGLMSYLYTSSALSDGYIHQFLICFRYIMTADQLLNFILEKFRSAQSHNGDVNLLRVVRRSLDLMHVWLEGYYSIDFSNNKRLLRKLADFLTEQNEANTEGAEELFSLYAACRMGDHAELMLATEMDEDDEEGATYFLHLTNPKRWESFRSLLRRSKSEKGSSGKSRSDFQGKPLGGLQRPVIDFSVTECPAHTLAEQLTLMEQETFRKCHPVHFLNSQCQGVGVALSIPGLRTPSMSRKLDSVQASKKGLFVGEPLIESYVVHMIAHSQEVSHWISAEVLSCGSNKSQANMITKFLTVGHLCLEVKNFATGLAILEGLENLVVRQLSVWKNVASKYMAYLDQMTAAKMKLKSEALALMSEKDCHVFPTIPSALFLALHLQQAEIGSFTLANGMYKWDKMRSICEIVDQARIFRDHEYGFRLDQDIQRALKRRLEDFSDQDLHTVASSQDNNFRRHSSSSSLSGTLKKVKDKLGSKKK
ncbi:protein very kind-like, partial [Plakobranchus ocellatus]